MERPARAVKLQPSLLNDGGKDSGPRLDRGLGARRGHALTRVAQNKIEAAFDACAVDGFVIERERFRQLPHRHAGGLQYHSAARPKVANSAVLVCIGIGTQVLRRSVWITGDASARSRRFRLQASFRDSEFVNWTFAGLGV